MAATNPFLRRWPALLLVWLVGGLVYANTFQSPFILDDQWAIVENPFIKNPAFIFTPSLWYEQYAGRIVALLTFALNYRLGGLDVTGYHLLNLLIHLASATLVYALLRQTFRTPFFSTLNSPPSTGNARVAFIPLLAALLFVVHPVQTQAVTYVVQRMTSLTTMFYLLSVLLYVQARLSVDQNSEFRIQNSEEKAPSFRVFLLFAGSVLAALLAMKTKEIAITLPVLVALYEISFFQGDWRRRLMCLLPLLATLPVVPLTVFSPGQAMGDALSDVSNQVQVQTSLSRPDYLLTQFRVIVTYLRLLVLPINQNLDYDYPVYTTFFTPPVFLSFLLLAALIALAIYLFYATRRGAVPASTFNPQPSTGAASGAPTDPVLRLISFGILWFFLTLSVESSIIPIPDVIFEHRLYLPCFGAAAAFATAFCLAADRIFKNVGGTLLGLCAALLVLSLGVATLQRNQVWGDAIRLWQDAVAKSPGKARPYNNLGVALNRAGRSAEAIQVLSRAIAIDPMHPDAYNNLGRAYISTGQSSAALPVLRTAIRINSEYKGAYINLAAALNQLRKFRETVSLVEQNIDLLGDQVEAHYHLGVAYAFLGDRAAARRQLEIVSRSGAADLAADLMRLLR